MGLSAVKSYIELIRLPNCLIIALATYVGYIVSSTSLQVSEKLLVLMLSSFFIAAGGNSINDYFDLEIDKVNKPWRPIPSGRISPNTAYKFSLLMFLIGTILSFLTNIQCILLAVLATLLLYYYSKMIKRKGFLGNITIATLSALNLLYGGFLGEEPLISLIPASYAFIIILGREVIKTIEDIKGDSIVGVKSLPIILGLKKSMIIASLILLTLVAISPIPFIINLYGIMYLIVAVLGVDLPVICALYYLVLKKNASLSKKILKIPLALGLIAFLVGEVIG